MRIDTIEENTRMSRIAFEELPAHGRLWVFPASRDLDPDERRRLMEGVDAFLDGWEAHGSSLSAASHLHEGRFLLIGVDTDVEMPSGCSVDALVGRLRKLGEELGVTLVDHTPIRFREGTAVRSVTRAEFRRLAEEGSVSPDTPIFDTTLTRVEEYRAGALERPARDTWAGRVYFRAAAAG